MLDKMFTPHQFSEDLTNPIVLGETDKSIAL